MRDRDRPTSAIPDGFAASPIPQQFAHTGSSATRDEADKPVYMHVAAFDRGLVRELLADLRAHPDAAMEYLYARLFTAHPGLRGFFQHAMTQTRAAVFREFTRLIEGLDDLQRTEQRLGQLARIHRKFGVRDNHYRPFFDAVVAMAEYVSGPAWTSQAAAAWLDATEWFTAVMTAAAADDAAHQPAWWTGEIVQHDRRTETVAVLTIRPDQPLHYQPGQYISVQTPRWPRIWRSYSIANAPRDNGLIDIHVRAVPGGMVSTALVSHCATGDTVLLAAARGEMGVPQDPARDLVCVAGGTGLAPLKAITEAVVGAAAQGRRREITLYVGVRRKRDLYDARDLETLRLAYPPLTVIPVAEHELDFAGRVGRLPEVVWTHPSFRDCDVYVAGPAGLVKSAAQVLSKRVPAGRLHHDPIEALELARQPQREDLGPPPAAEGS
ncbi:MAG TPA: FAD-binding oxidoreductase [Streptosporangiaceae bacterium]|jgi:NAD(P)H-flavin reductase/hemoglobin-like flavoprotein|nr:FAD-binding oxidoreductase [Streptosporangiaceae bacterium]